MNYFYSSSGCPYSMKNLNKDVIPDRLLVQENLPFINSNISTVACKTSHKKVNWSIPTTSFYNRAKASHKNGLKST